MRIGSVIGSSTNDVDEPRFHTDTSAKAGMNLLTGSVSSNLPSSHSIITATEVMGFVMEKMRNSESACSSEPDSTSACPYVDA